MIKTQIHSRRRKPTKSSGAALTAPPPGLPVAQAHHVMMTISHDQNSNQSDPGEGGCTSSGGRSTLDASAPEIKGADSEGCDQDVSDRDLTGNQSTNVKQ